MSSVEIDSSILPGQLRRSATVQTNLGAVVLLRRRRDARSQRNLGAGRASRLTIGAVDQQQGRRGGEGEGGAHILCGSEEVAEGGEWAARPKRRTTTGVKRAKGGEGKDERKRKRTVREQEEK